MSKRCCNQEAKYVVFTTFEYWYCEVCKQEVEDNSPPQLDNNDENEWTKHYFF